jgi:hypothetical protein
MLVVALIRLLAERRHDPPWAVEVEDGGHWWPGFHSRWLLCVDGRGWMAQVEFSMQHEWGGREHLQSVPPERLRIPG